MAHEGDGQPNEVVRGPAVDTPVEESQVQRILRPLVVGISVTHQQYPVIDISK